MKRVLERVDSWFNEPAAPDRLGALRIMVGLFASVYLVLRFPAFHALGSAPDREFEPVGVLWLLGSPLPSPAVTIGLFATIALGVAFTVGACFRVCGPLFALLLLVTTTYHSSWGQLLWFENLMVLHVLILGFSASADACAVDARIHSAPAPNPAYGWPVRLAAVVTVLTYVLAGVAKLRIGGLDWLRGDTLRNHIAYSAARLDLLGATPSPLARPLVANGWMAAPVALLVVVVELCAPVALIGGRIRDTWVAIVWMMHAATAAVMFVVFPYPLLLVAFAPLYPLERMLDRVSGPARRMPRY